MKAYVVLAAVSLVLPAGGALAEGEGGGDPFPFRAAPLVMAGQPFVSDTGSEAYPTAARTRERPSALGLLEPGTGSETPVQTAQSLPLRFNEGTVAYTQAEAVNQHFALQARMGRVQIAARHEPRG